MMRLIYGLIAFCTLLLIGGCATSPYEYGNNWLLRENDIPQYYSKFDLFYIGRAPAGYGDTHDIQFNWTKTHPFVLLAEGKAADLLYKVMQKTGGLTVKNGFIAAYLPDMTPKTAEQIADDFYWKGLKAAENAKDYGVIVTWTSRINQEKIENPDALKGAYMINPLNWKTDQTPGTPQENIKAVFYMPEHKNIFWRKVEVKNFCGAVIDPEKGVLEVNCPVALLHVVNGRFTNNCISIFAGNIAANAKLRTETLMKAREWGNAK